MSTHLLLYFFINRPDDSNSMNTAEMKSAETSKKTSLKETIKKSKEQVQNFCDKVKNRMKTGQVKNLFLCQTLLFLLFSLDCSGSWALSPTSWLYQS